MDDKDIHVPTASPPPRSGAGPRRLTRRDVLIAGGAAAASLGLSSSSVRAVRAGVTLAASTAVAPVLAGFVSRPDLKLPGLTVIATDDRPAAPGLLLLAPYNAPAPAQAGALIVDNTGQPVWEQPLASLVTTDFRVQQYRGRPMLTWWEGLIRLGHGVGRYVIADAAYTPVAHLDAGHGRQGDLHEFLLTDRGTALLTTYSVVPADLRSVGGLRDDTIQDAIFQEIDLASGRVLMEWHSLDHIPMSESYWPVGRNWDYVHLNSIAVDRDENLLVSSRNTHTVYKLDRRTGAIIWRLGGKRSDFTLASNAVFRWQHDARRQPDGSITLFDNGDDVSRAVVLNIDEAARRASLRRAYTHPSELYSDSQGNVQVLPNGNVLVGWGAQPYVSEFTAGGDLIFDGRLDAGYISYRAYRAPWSAAVTDVPAVVAVRATGHTDVHVSWNGATRVTHWTVLAGAQGNAIVGSARRTGFETIIRVPRTLRRLRVAANDAAGRVLSTSAAIEA
jgi:hypothetical protein